jgi:hypothetical protein
MDDYTLNIKARLIHFGLSAGFGGTLAACVGQWYRLSETRRAMTVITLEEPLGDKWLLEAPDVLELVGSQGRVH